VEEAQRVLAGDAPVVKTYGISTSSPATWA
jgi:hypothetical protein